MGGNTLKISLPYIRSRVHSSESARHRIAAPELRWQRMDANGDPRVVLVHDWLTGMRGGEKCLELLCRRWRRAPLFTLLHRPGSVSEVIERRPIHTSFLANLPAVDRYYRYALPLMPAAVETWRLPRCDLVVSFSIALLRRRGRRATCRTSAIASRRCATLGTCGNRILVAGNFAASDPGQWTDCWLGSGTGTSARLRGSRIF